MAGFCWGGARTWEIANAEPLAAAMVFYGTGPQDAAGVYFQMAEVYEQRLAYYLDAGRAWLAWTVVGLRIHDAISAFAEAGRILRGGGENIESAGAQLGDALAGLPLVGAGIDDVTTRTFQSAGEPFQYVGGELESLLLLIARLLAILVIAVFLVPWLLRYVPWRASRLDPRASLR